MLRNSLPAFALAMLTAQLLFCVPVADAQPIVYYHAESTRKVAQLTGDYDRPWGRPTLNATFTQASMEATDLGSTFEHDGKLVFLFGDTWGGRNGLLDSWGVSTSMDPWNVTLQIPVARDGKWRAISPPGLNLAEFCVPSHGISLNGTMYVVFTQPGTNGDIMKRSWMTSSADNGVTWQTLYQLDNHTDVSPRFVNVWLEEHGQFIYMFGSGMYRAGSPYLARALKSSFPAKSAWTFYQGTSGGVPIWTNNIALANRVFTHDQLGEFSCSWVETLGCWVMLYNSASPRGIVMRAAANPWGPWSDPTVIMDPFVDQAYGNYMHINWDVAKVDLFSDPGRQSEWGGEYGPYIIPRFTRGTTERCELYYTMSTWNPYQVLIMRSILSTVAPPPPPFLNEVRTLGHELWTRYPEGIGEPFIRDGRHYLTTYGGDNLTGWLWQKIPEGTAEISFNLHGGHAEIFLLENSSGLPLAGSTESVDLNIRSGAYGRIVRRATGVDTNDTDVAWTWNTRELDTSSLVLVVLDSMTDSWGFLSFSDIVVKVPLLTSSVSDWAVY